MAAAAPRWWDRDMKHLDGLQREGAMCWRAEERAWVADPERVVRELQDHGFQEYKREIARRERSHAPTGGMWQGLDADGTVATVIWVTQSVLEETHVFIEIGGRSIEGSAWAEIDDAVLGALTAGGGRLTLEQIAACVGMSEDAVRSVVSMLAEQRRVRIAMVELACGPCASAVRPDGDGTSGAGSRL
jgi:hypothetical protein